MALPKIYEALYHKEVFSFQDVLELGYSADLAKKTLYRLKKDGYIGRIRGGSYYVIPLESRMKSYTPDRYKVGSLIISPYFFSHHSALDVHGVAYYSSNTVYISSPKRFSSFSFGGVHFKNVFVKYHFGVEKAHRGNVEIFVSDPERTFLDGLRRLDLVGGLEQFLKSVEGFPYLQPDKIIEYLQQFNEKSLYHRAGFVLESLKDAYGLPVDFLEKLKTFVTPNVYYLEPSAKKGTSRFVKKWNLMIPTKL